MQFRLNNAHNNGFFCRLASTPAMFDSTITENEAFLCPADGSIMITGDWFISFVIHIVTWSDWPS